MRKFGEDANRLALALDHAEAGSDLEREIIHSFLERFAATQRHEEAKWWRYLVQMHDESYFAVEGDKRIGALEAERQGKGEK